MTMQPARYLVLRSSIKQMLRNSQIDSKHIPWHKIEYIHSNQLRRGHVDDPVH